MMSRRDEPYKIIKQHQLTQHEEGGYYKVTFVSEVLIDVEPARYVGGKRPACSKIDYLLMGHDYSAFHQLKSNEVWRYKQGTSLTLYMIQQDGTLTTAKIGDPSQESDASAEFLVMQDQWFAVVVNDNTSFSYVECEVTPGFDYRDWQLGEQDDLIKCYPQHADLIRKYSRNT